MNKSTESWQSWPIDAKRQLLSVATVQLEGLPRPVQPEPEHNPGWQLRLDLEAEMTHLGLICWICRVRQAAPVTNEPPIRLWPHERRAHLDAMAEQVAADSETLCELTDGDIRARLKLLQRRGLVDRRWTVDLVRDWGTFFPFGED